MGIVVVRGPLPLAAVGVRQEVQVCAQQVLVDPVPLRLWLEDSSHVNRVSTVKGGHDILRNNSHNFTKCESFLQNHTLVPFIVLIIVMPNLKICDLCAANPLYLINL